MSHGFIHFVEKNSNYLLILKGILRNPMALCHGKLVKKGTCFFVDCSAVRSGADDVQAGKEDCFHGAALHVSAAEPSESSLETLC